MHYHNFPRPSPRIRLVRKATPCPRHPSFVRLCRSLKTAPRFPGITKLTHDCGRTSKPPSHTQVTRCLVSSTNLGYGVVAVGSPFRRTRFRRRGQAVGLFFSALPRPPNSHLLSGGQPPPTWIRFRRMCHVGRTPPLTPVNFHAHPRQSVSVATTAPPRTPGANQGGG